MRLAIFVVLALALATGVAVAAGPDTLIWDIAAGALLIQEAGGELTDFSGGSRFWERGNVIAGTRGVAEGLRSLAAPLFRDDEI